MQNCNCFHYDSNGQPSASVVDILIENETIAEVRENIPKDGVDRVYDLQGMEVFPGGIDSHVHFNYVQGGDKAVSADDFGTGS